MVRQARRIKFKDFTADIDRVFEEVDEKNKEVLVERRGRLFRIEPVRQNIWAGYDPEKVRAALRDAAGILKGVDRKALMRRIHAARGQSSLGRPGD